MALKKNQLSALACVTLLPEPDHIVKTLLSVIIFLFFRCILLKMDLTMYFIMLLEKVSF